MRRSTIAALLTFVVLAACDAGGGGGGDDGETDGTARATEGPTTPTRWATGS